MLDLGENGQLAFDGLGGRRLSKSGQAESGPVAPEPLTGAVERAGVLYALGVSGRTYAAQGPVAPWTLRQPAKRALIGTSVASSGEFLGIGANGQLWISQDLGEIWKADSAPSFFTALGGSGRDVVLRALPESYFIWSRGKPLERLPDTFGGGTLERDADGKWGVRATDGFHALEAGVPNASLGPAAPVERFVRAAELRAGTSSLNPDGTAVAFVPLESGTFRLWTGTDRLPLAATDRSLGCEPKRVARSGENIYVICEKRGKRRGVGFQFLGARAGLPFQSLGEGLRGTEESLKLRASGSAVAFSGTCPPIENEPGCDPRGLFFAQWGEEGSAEVPIADGRVPLDFDFAGDGSLWALTLSTRDQHLVLYRVTVHRTPDSDPSKPPASITVPAKAAPRFQIASLDLTDLFHLSSATTAAQLLPSDRSVMGAVIGSKERTLVLALDSSLHVLGFGNTPGPITNVGGVGERVVAVHEPSRTIVETLDGGLSWARSVLPSLPGADGDISVHCARGGCVVGDELFRAGFGSVREVDARRARGAAEGSDAGDPALTPIECQSRGGPRFHLEGADSRPTAHDAARGDVFWSQVASRPKDGSAWVYHARFGEQSIERKELFPRVSSASGLALSVSEQVEGAAALRFRIKKGKTSRVMLDEVEVAWDNRMVGRICHGNVPMELPGSGLDYEGRADGTALAKPSLLTVSGDTLYLEFRTQGPAGGAFFAVDDCGKAQRTLSFPSGVRSDLLTERELVRDGGADFFLRLSRDGWLVSSEDRDGRSRVMRLAGVPERRDLVFSVNLGYLGSEARFTTVIADGDGMFWRAESLPIRGLLDRVPPSPDRVPLLSDVKEPLRACTLDERRNSVRVVSPAFPRGERAVVVQGFGEPIPFMVGRAVVQGSRENPCVAALEGIAGSPGTTSNPTDTEVGVLVDLDPGGVSWLFEKKNQGAGRGVSASALDCLAVPAQSASPESGGASDQNHSNPK